MQALVQATERDMLCAGSQGTVLDNSLMVTAAYGTELNAAAPAWAEELTHLVQAATLQEDRNPRPGSKTCLWSLSTTAVDAAEWAGATLHQHIHGCVSSVPHEKRLARARTQRDCGRCLRTCGCVTACCREGRRNQQRGKSDGKWWYVKSCGRPYSRQCMGLRDPESSVSAKCSVASARASAGANQDGMWWTFWTPERVGPCRVVKRLGEVNTGSGCH